jgi:hypothetical protein
LRSTRSNETDERLSANAGRRFAVLNFPECGDPQLRELRLIRGRKTGGVAARPLVADERSCR